VNLKSNGDNPIIAAIEKGYDMSVIKILLDKGADVTARRKRDGATTLMIASLWSYEPAMRVLLEKGVDVNAKDNNGFTALMISSTGDDQSIVKMLFG
jgi:ankyrin repeat protein